MLRKNPTCFSYQAFQSPFLPFRTLITIMLILFSTISLNLKFSLLIVCQIYYRNCTLHYDFWSLLVIFKPRRKRAWSSSLDAILIKKSNDLGLILNSTLFPNQCSKFNLWNAWNNMVLYMFGYFNGKPAEPIWLLNLNDKIILFHYTDC